MNKHSLKYKLILMILIALSLFAIVGCQTHDGANEQSQNWVQAEAMGFTFMIDGNWEKDIRDNSATFNAGNDFHINFFPQFYMMPLKDFILYMVDVNQEITMEKSGMEFLDYGYGEWSNDYLSGYIISYTEHYSDATLSDLPSKDKVKNNRTYAKGLFFEHNDNLYSIYFYAYENNDAFFDIFDDMIDSLTPVDG